MLVREQLALSFCPKTCAGQIQMKKITNFQSFEAFCMTLIRCRRVMKTTKTVTTRIRSITPTIMGTVEFTESASHCTTLVENTLALEFRNASTWKPNICMCSSPWFESTLFVKFDTLNFAMQRNVFSIGMETRNELLYTSWVVMFDDHGSGIYPVLKV